MASLHLHPSLFLILHIVLFMSIHQVNCNDDEDNLLQGINSYRQSLKLQPLPKNGNADCLAEQIADEYEDRACPATTTGATNIAVPGTVQVTNYPKLLSKCNIDINTTKSGVILPVCVHKLVPTLVLTNYTHTQYARYLNDSKFSGAGLGSEDDWMVLVLSTSSMDGSFANEAWMVSKFGLGYYFFYLFFMGLCFYGI